MPGRRLTAVLLLLLLALVIAALVRTTASAPSFRAADYPTLSECMRSIPVAWAPGSLERERAERACHHEEQQRRAGRR